MKKLLLFALFGIFISLTTAEVMLRCFGFTPWQPIPIEDDVKYYPKSPFYQDTILGYKMHSGSYDITYGGNYTFRVTIDSGGYRVVSSARKSGNKKLLIFGDSFTLGSGLNDDEVYPKLLQDSLSDFWVKNYAIPGYGVANVYTQITTMFLPDSGDLCIYSYFKQHDNRYIRSVLKMMYANLKIMGSLGFMRLSEQSGEITSVFQPYNYKMCFLSPYSALANLLEDSYNSFIDKQENLVYEELAQKAVFAMDSFCKSRGATFVLYGIQRDDGTEKMLNFCSEHKILSLDISVDLNDNKFNQMPYDNHPNAYSNRLFAKKILRHLSSFVVADVVND